MKIGDKIKILNMKDEPQYSNAVGTITFIGEDPWGDEYFRGTWGGCSVYPKVDTFEKIN